MGRVFAVLASWLAGAAVAWASAPATPPDPARDCRVAIRAAERAHAVPDRLLASVSVVESGRRDPVGGQVTPWPWTINAEGVGHVYDTKAEAVAAVDALRKTGVRSIDVGCLQINLMAHPDAFGSLDEAFDPHANADYAARFLTGLFAQTGAWPKAVGLYHSANPELGEPYAEKVLALWPKEGTAPPPAEPLISAPAFGRTLPFMPPSHGMARGGGGTDPPMGRDLAAYRAAPVGMRLTGR